MPTLYSYRVLPATWTAPRGGAGLGDLPVWDFSALYAGPGRARGRARFRLAGPRMRAISPPTYEGKLAGLDAGALLDCVTRYETIEQVAGRLMSYFGLRYYQNTADTARAKAMSDAQDRVTNAQRPRLSFSRWN